MKIKFSKHSLQRIKARKISKNMVIKVVEKPEESLVSFRGRRLFRLRTRDKIRMHDKILEVVAVEEDGIFEVITAYYLEGKKDEN